MVLAMIPATARSACVTLDAAFQSATQGPLSSFFAGHRDESPLEELVVSDSHSTRCFRKATRGGRPMWRDVGGLEAVSCYEPFAPGTRADLLCRRSRLSTRNASSISVHPILPLSSIQVTWLTQRSRTSGHAIEQRHRTFPFASTLFIPPSRPFFLPPHLRPLVAAYIHLASRICLPGIALTSATVGEVCAFSPQKPPLHASSVSLRDPAQRWQGASLSESPLSFASLAIAPRRHARMLAPSLRS